MNQPPYPHSPTPPPHGQAPRGYGQPPYLAQHAGAGMMPATVWGVPLEPGERVIYYHRSDTRTQRIVLIVVGVLTLVFVLGLFFLLAGLTGSDDAYVITTRRFMKINDKKRLEMMIPHGHVRRVLRKMKGGSLRWIELYDPAERCLSFQVAAGPGLDGAIQQYVSDPRSVEAAPQVRYEP